MMHHKGNEHSQAYSLTGSYHCQQRRTGTQGHRQGRHPRSCCSLLLALALSLYDDEHRKGNEHSQGHRNTDRLTPLQALAIADTGGQDTGGTPPHHWRPLTQATGSPLLALAPRSMMMHHKGNERSQGHRNTDRLTHQQAHANTDTQTGGATSTGRE